MLEIKIPEIRGDNIKEKKIGVARLNPLETITQKVPEWVPRYFIHQNYITNISNNLNSKTVMSTNNKPTHLSGFSIYAIIFFNDCKVYFTEKNI